LRRKVNGMADLQKARSAFLAMVKDLDPDVECSIAAKPVQGSYLVTLSREGEEQVVKVSEKELATFEADENLHQKLEERVLTAIDELPGGFAEAEDEEEEFEEEGEDEEEEEEEEDLEEEEGFADEDKEEEEEDF
jgi:hypothetical protein